MTKHSINITNAAGQEITVRWQPYMRTAVLIITACITVTVPIRQIKSLPGVNVVEAGNIYMHGIEKDQQDKLEDFLSYALRECAA